MFCDDVEPPPFFAVGERAQRRCAVRGLHTLLEFDAILVTVDGRRPVDITVEVVGGPFAGSTSATVVVTRGT